MTSIIHRMGKQVLPFILALEQHQHHIFLCIIREQDGNIMMISSIGS